MLPPETEADIGPDDFVQWADGRVEVVDRTGKLLLGPVPGNTVWSGFGGLCEASNQGHLLVRYDRAGDRWVLSQFAYGVNDRGIAVAPYYQCVAVSANRDPTDELNRYSFLVSNTYFSDDLKLAAWPDAYYMSANLWSGPDLSTFNGAGAVAFDRASMLAGQPASAIIFGPLGKSYAGLLPSDLDGSIIPRSGTPNYFGAIDTSVAPSGSTFQLWEFHVDWATPTNSTFGTGSNSPNFNLTTAPYNWQLCDGASSCISQPGSSVGIYPASDRLQDRLRYRRFPDGHESLVANHTVNASTTPTTGGNQAGIRWYEVRGPLSTSPLIYQQGTYAPDNDSRFMGSIAMDRAGDIMLGYLVSGGSTYPSYRYAGHAASDPPGTLTRGEVPVIAGSTPQVLPHYRSGDYSIIGVDPLDECTFLYTQQAHPTINGGWQTRLGSFGNPSCGQPSASLIPTNAPASWINNETVSYTVGVTNTGTQPWPAQGKTPVQLGVHFARKGGGYGVTGSGTGTSSGWLTDQRFPLPTDVPPGATINLTVSVTAPATTGDLVLEYEAVWEGRLWFKQFVDVSTTVVAGPVASYRVNATPSRWINSQTQSYVVSITNTGNQLWPAKGTKPVHLGVHFARTGGGYGVTGSGTGTSSGWLTDQRFSLPADVPPGASVSLTVSVTAPATATGKLVLEYEVLWEGRMWFTQFADVSATVASPVASYGAATTPLSWIKNETLSYTVGLTNTGTQPWPAQGKTPVLLGVHFARTGGGYGVSGSGARSGWLTDQRFPLPSDVPPGAAINLTVSVTAPATTGDLVLEYEAVWEGRLWFKQFVDVSTTVVAGPVASYRVNATPSRWINSQTQSYVVSITNTGNQLWPAQGTKPVHLGVHFARTSGGYGVTGSGTGTSSGWLTDQRFFLPADVPPGASVSLTVSVTAPATATGTLVLEYEAVWEGRLWFSPFADVNTTVQAGSVLDRLTATPSGWASVLPDLAIVGIILAGLALTSLVRTLVARSRRGGSIRNA